MAGTIKKIAGPAYLSNLAADIYTPPNAAVDVVIRHMHFANVTAAAKTFSLYVGATGGSAGGTELFKDFSIAANSVYDWYGALRLSSTQFLSGVASAASAITVTVEGEYVAN